MSKGNSGHFVGTKGSEYHKNEANGNSLRSKRNSSSTTMTLPKETSEHYSKRKLIKEVIQKGEKITSKNVLSIVKLDDGKINWVEVGKVGKKGSGLNHIVEHHTNEFAKFGIKSKSIPKLLTKTLKEGKIIGYYKGRTPVYQAKYRRRTFNLLIAVGTNGYIVTAYPVSENITKEKK